MGAGLFLPLELLAKLLFFNELELFFRPVPAREARLRGFLDVAAILANLAEMTSYVNLATGGFRLPPPLD
jgi:hypothetical protein